MFKRLKFYYLRFTPFEARRPKAAEAVPMAGRPQTGFTPFKVRAQGAAAIKDGLLQTGFTLTPNFGVAPRQSREGGFTLMELIVATTIFAVFSVAVTSLFNYDFRIMRRTEALRQATQGMRNFTDFIVKEIRNGQIDYSVNYQVSPVISVQPVAPCPMPNPVQPAGTPTNGANTYTPDSTALALITQNGRICIFWADNTGNFNAVTKTNLFYQYQNNTGLSQNLNPPNFIVDDVHFFIRPLKDPHDSSVGNGGFALMQPFVTIAIKFRVQLPTGETAPITYQTTISSDKYDIPN